MPVFIVPRFFVHLPTRPLAPLLLEYLPVFPVGLGSGLCVRPCDGLRLGYVLHRAPPSLVPGVVALFFLGSYMVATLKSLMLMVSHRVIVGLVGHHFLLCLPVVACDHLTCRRVFWGS